MISYGISGFKNSPKQNSQPETYLFRDWVPQEFLNSWTDTPAFKLLDYEVVESYTSGDNNFFTCPIDRANIYNWCVVSNGSKKYAVAWNENPSRGWSFPIKRIKE